MPSCSAGQYDSVFSLFPLIRYSYVGCRWFCRKSGDKRNLYAALQISDEFHRDTGGARRIPDRRVLVLYGIIRTLFGKTYIKGIWFAGIGTILTVLALLLCAGYNNTAYYPSTADLQSSLTLANSCSSQFTLKVMAYVSILVPYFLPISSMHGGRSIRRR